jgi:two-component system, OmpR family, alkaline phosphatase synthesis response regulator PhoP
LTGSTHTILLVDDEPDILEFLGYNLRREAYEVFTATDGHEALEKARKIKPHLIILDVMMPGMDGIETCMELRKISTLSDTLIMFLTARAEDYSQISGLDAGADDYITKPVRPRVFLSKVAAMLRRIRIEEQGSACIEIAGIIIDREKYLVYRGGKEISLPRKEFELLSLLASKPNKVFSREEIFSVVWGDGVIVGDRTIDVHIRKLRKEIEIPNIRTVKGVGYKFYLA